jgi:hypothetical protein
MDLRNFYHICNINPRDKVYFTLWRMPMHKYKLGKYALLIRFACQSGSKNYFLFKNKKQGQNMLYTAISHNSEINCSAPLIAKHILVKVGLQAFLVGITLLPPKYRLVVLWTFENLSTTESLSSAPALVVPQIWRAKPGSMNCGSEPGR